MPIGVPRVPYQCPGDANESWVDLYNRLYRERLLFLGQLIDSEIANQLMALMLYLNGEENNKDMYLFINSPGGWIIPGLAIYDTMQFLKADIHTIGMGLAASMGSFILAGGAITKRVAFPSARVMIHQPACLFYDVSLRDTFKETEEVLALRETLTRVYAQKTGKPFWVVSKDLERDTYMSAREAQAYGIVDFVGGDRVL
uniref:ATP-dependent Clp protease proteolytic subunit n=1 Tax=Dischidia nummularia TaxID=1381998 RepID=A0A8F5VDQ7_9GENT|nr:clp protease proteolytic subunit [Dischidia nummularia]QXO88966.1 ClpP [Dischidia nummularia]WAB52791.1 clp protease proteolytic subunit [Dischidia nummularia]WEV91976.1 clp protease proteolytic subunit [Dischidia nummularia]